MKAIYIDTRSRLISAKAVWVTQIAPGQLIIREAVELPHIPKSAELYIVDATGYSALSSEGFVEVFHESSFNQFSIIGELLIGEGGLKPVAPREVFMIKRGYIQPLTTHENSNVDVANTAYYSLKESYKYLSNSVLIMEGQSDQTNAIDFSGEVITLAEKEDSKGNLELEFPEEHRQDIVNPISVQAADIMDEHYWQYYNDIEYSAAEKHNSLLKKVIISIIAETDEEIKFGNAFFQNLDRKVANVIVSEMVRRGASLEECLDEFEERYREKAIAILDNILNVQLIEAHHDDNNRLFTWVVPDTLIDNLRIGAKVEVETKYGIRTVTINNIFRGPNINRHKSVLGLAEEVE
ncbi:hypothetical protein M3202_17615 [Alkalihalobacillus oceani]|uniref:Uncharacterized protein n=1 Tax=Halalkalibacter oceani TaxID=1653776 RepID=A0A9X2DTI8_9BACI|nr:hypothetical protein [Halalkalibacter oceani]MCM3715875.1 hypothetical protein [Halalkalibacter oceani]